MPRPWTLPSGVTLENLDEYAREHTNAARRASYAKHPDRVIRQRLVSAANLLNRYGLIDNQQKQTITENIKVVAANG